MPRLDETRNFLELFTHACGKSEIPWDFFFWSGMSVLAASVADRVWLEPDRGRKIFPNLYVMLLGPSGIGKEYAINKAAELAVDQPVINLYGGIITAQYLLKYMSRKSKGPHGYEFINTKVYLIMEELGMSVRGGEQAHDFVTHTTGLYKCRPYPFKKGTITGEEYTIPDPCLNCLIGTTEEWLTKTLGRDAIAGGWTARVIIVTGRKDYAVRFPRMEIPEDLDDVMTHLRLRVEGYTQAGGSLLFSPEAVETHDKWYNSRVDRPDPKERSEEPGFNRADEMIHRFATLLALADWDVTQEGVPNGWVEAQHVEDAITLWNQVSEQSPYVTKLASASRRTTNAETVLEITHRFGGVIDRANLTKRASGYGLSSDDVDFAVKDLVNRGDFESPERVLTEGSSRRTKHIEYRVRRGEK